MKGRDYRNPHEAKDQHDTFGPSPLRVEQRHGSPRWRQLHGIGNSHAHNLDRPWTRHHR
jgi:hypothetical protein